MAQRINHCIGLRFLSNQSILSILDEAEKIKSGDSIVNLQNQSVAHVFFEPSTRTRLSFEMATQRCQAFPMMLDVKTSSLTKGELGRYDA